MPTTGGGSSSGGGGAMSLLSSTLLTGTAASFDITGIAGTFNHLLLTYQARSDASAATVLSSFRLNGDTGANYDRAVDLTSGANPVFNTTAASTSLYIGDITAATAAAGTISIGQILIPFYAKATFNKSVLVSSGGVFAVLGTTTTYALAQVSGLWRNTAAVTQVTLAPSSGVWVIGSGLTVHGIL
jgi:hypothetical protein